MKVCLNGQFYASETPLLKVQNRGYKWGDGLFETMKFYRGRLLLADLHFERLFTSLQLLGIEATEMTSRQTLLTNIAALCAENNTTACARVRLAVFRNDDNTAGYSLESIPLDEATNQWQAKGLRVCLYPHARKSMDAFANLKSANYLPYVLAQRFATERKVDEALVLNAANAICDASKANVFLRKGNTVFTPALHQGCVSGVMRRVVMETVKCLGFRLHHDEVTEADLLSADEVFLTNAIQMIRWVRQYKQTQYGCEQTKKIFDAVATTIFDAPC